MKILILIILILHTVMYIAIANDPRVQHLRNFAYILAIILLLATTYQGNQVYMDYLSEKGQ